jgi:hypothetical protein
VTAASTSMRSSCCASQVARPRTASGRPAPLAVASAPATLPAP